MSEKLTSALEMTWHAINNKAVSFTVAGGLVVAGKTAEEAANSQYKNLSEISISELFMYDLSVASVIALIGSAWIVTQFAILFGKSLFWAYKKLRGE